GRGHRTRTQPQREVTMPDKTYDFTTEDTEYLRHGERRLIARVYRPKGNGPFPAVIDLHGGAWTSGDLTGTQGLDQTLARHGFLVASLEFRHNADGYPTSLADINYAVRQLKARSRELGLRPDRVGLAGQSSGGHLAMLAAMRPRDPRYAAIPLPAGSPAVDASVQAVAMSWPVINPLSRYRNAIRRAAEANPPAFAIGMKEKHDTYWKTEANMAEGNPLLILERGDTVEMPPALWVQGRPDEVHDYHDPDSSFPGNEPERFVSNYRKAGGAIEIVYVPYDQRMTAASFEPIAAFFTKHLG
ncbi:MAG: alpha/beta hydrolase, partial [Stellaceae bacterium]